MAFRDVDSRAPSIRMETWSELAVNDYLLVGGELLRIRELPRNPDDDCRFFAEQNQRLGFLGTTPTHESQGTPMYKVGVHPPGTTFPRNGLPVVTLFWRNDDGGPGFGKDSRLVFDPPADGVYRVRVTDAHGEGGKAHAYRLTIREPRPDYTVRFSIAKTVSRGGAVPVRVNVERLDEFDGPIDLKLLHLPPGLSAPATSIPAGENSTAFALHAAPTAAVTGRAPLELGAAATINGNKVVRKATGAVPAVIAPGDVVTTTEQSEVTLKPGGEVHLTVKVERRERFHRAGSAGRAGTAARGARAGHWAERHPDHPRRDDANGGDLRGAVGAADAAAVRGAGAARGQGSGACGEVGAAARGETVAWLWAVHRELVRRMYNTYRRR